MYIVVNCLFLISLTYNVHIIEKYILPLESASIIISVFLVF